MMKMIQRFALSLSAAAVLCAAWSAVAQNEPSGGDQNAAAPMEPSEPYAAAVSNVPDLPPSPPSDSVERAAESAQETPAEAPPIEPTPPGSARARALAARLDRENMLLRQRLREMEAQERENRSARKDLARKAKEAEAVAAKDAAKQKDRLEQAMEDLEQQTAAAAAKDRQIAALAQELEALRDQMKKAARRASEPDDDNALKLARELEASESQYRELKTAHEQNVQTVESLRQNLAKAQKDLTAFKAEALEKSRDVQKRDEQIRDLKAEMETVRKESIAGQEQALDQADTRIKQAEERQGALEKEVAALKAARTEDLKTIEGLNRQLAAADKRAEETKSATEERDAELARKDGQIEAFQKQLATTRQEAEERLNRAADALEALRKELDAVQDAAAQKAQLTGDLRSRAGSLQKDLVEIQAAVADKEAALSARATEMGMLSRELAEARMQATNALHELQTAREGAAAELRETAEARDRLKEELEAARAGDESSQAAIAGLQQQVSDLESQLSDMKAAVGQKDLVAEQIRQVLRTQGQLRQEVADLKSKNAEQAQTIERQRSDLTAVVKKAAELKETSARQARILADRDAALKGARDELDAAQTKLAESQRAMAGMVENLRLKEALAESQARERQRMTNDLAQARTAGMEIRDAVASLTLRLKEAEEETVRLKSALSDKDAALFARDQQVKTLNASLERQERAVAKLQATKAAAPARAGTRVLSEDSKKLRATQGRMAADYVSLGKYREAEKAYLSVLQLNPADPEAHYNLGILYDDKLKDKGMAAVHYREYLRLRPNASDAAQVKGWLTEAEMARQ